MAKVTITLEDDKSTGEVVFNITSDDAMSFRNQGNTPAQRAAVAMIERYLSLVDDTTELTIDGRKVDLDG